jgi:NADPH:quinone reductase-like Zn-dependent oxidoreductase
LGENVTRFSVSDRVIDNDMVAWLDGDAPPPGSSFQSGRLAQYGAAPAEWFVAAPRSLDEVAASTPSLNFRKVDSGLIEEQGRNRRYQHD